MQIPGVQRLQCYPFRKTKNFEGRTFHGKNQQDIVALIPSDVVASDFQYDGQLEPAKIQLLFDFRILRYYRRSLNRWSAPPRAFC